MPGKNEDTGGARTQGWGDGGEEGEGKEPADIPGPRIVRRTSGPGKARPPHGPPPPAKGGKGAGKAPSMGAASWPRLSLALVAILVLMFIPPITVEVSRATAEPLRVGIVLSEEAHGDFTSMVISGLQKTFGRGDIAVTAVPERMDPAGFEHRASALGVQYNTRAFNDPGITGPLRERHGVDALVFITQHDISDFRSGLAYVAGCTEVRSLSSVVSYARFVPGDGTWGPAGTEGDGGIGEDGGEDAGEDGGNATAGGAGENGTTAVLPFARRPLENPVLVEQMEKLSAHEFGHLLGYTHRMDGSVMSFRPAGEDVSLNDQELNAADDAQLGMRVEMLKVVSRGGLAGGGLLGLNLLTAALQLPFLGGLALAAVLLVPMPGPRVLRNRAGAMALGLVLAFLAVLLANPLWAALLPFISAGLVSGLQTMEERDPLFYRSRRAAAGLAAWCGAGALGGLFFLTARLAATGGRYSVSHFSVDSAYLVEFLGIFTLVLTLKTFMDLRRTRIGEGGGEKKRERVGNGEGGKEGRGRGAD